MKAGPDGADTHPTGSPGTATDASASARPRATATDELPMSDAPADRCPRPGARAVASIGAVAGALLAGAVAFAATGENGSGLPPVPGLARVPEPVPVRPVGEAALELMRAAGLDDEIAVAARTLADALAEGFASADADDDPERARLAAEVAARLFTVERVHDAVARRVQGALDGAEIARLLALHESPLGRRLRAAERARNLRTDPELLERAIDAARERPDFDARLAALAALVAETGLDELVARRSADRELAALHGALVADPTGVGPEFDERVAEVEWRRDVARFAVARELPELLAGVYATLPDADLAILLEASRRGERRRLLEALGAGLHDAVLAGTAEFGERWRGALRRASLSDDAL